MSKKYLSFKFILSAVLPLISLTLESHELLEECLGMTWNGQVWASPIGYLPRKEIKAECPQIY